MTIKLEIEKLEIPFRVSFKHSSAERSVTESVLVKAVGKGGAVGIGEGCPRSYVTGESVETAREFLWKHDKEISEIGNVDNLKLWVTNNGSQIDHAPAAWCAIELALLDLFGKLQGKSIERILGITEISGTFCYSAVLGAPSAKIFTTQLTQYSQLGFLDYKLKIGGELAVDKANLGQIKAVLPEASIRLDANNTWSEIDEAYQYLKELDSDFWAVEEPLAKNDLTSLYDLGKKINKKIILDESFLTIGQLAEIEGQPAFWIPNIRISKMGGIIRSLAIANQCEKLGIKFIIGAQVGETSILTRAALTVANSFRGSLLAQEGAFGTNLLSTDVTDTPLMFGKRGILKVGTPTTAGLGLNFNR